NQGIQTLLKAERDAHKIVSEARQYRTGKLKAAKLDAAKEIQEYKKKKELELKKFEEEHSGLNINADKEAAATVQAEVEKLKETAAQKKDEVVSLLVEAVIKPTPEIHVNAL
ncbi:H(+)-transporting V1 sector ATPase subunit G, partial [Ascoidea rubescens DSM 1968]